MDIEKIAFDYLYNSEQPESEEDTAVVKKIKRRSRRALQNSYEIYKKNYVNEKRIVESIKNQALDLEKQYLSHKDKMDSYHKRMLEIREMITKMDDDGVNYIEV